MASEHIVDSLPMMMDSSLRIDIYISLSSWSFVFGVFGDYTVEAPDAEGVKVETFET